MRIHILGVSGTFMSGIAVLAQQCGHEVTGSDMNVYPPMSTQLRDQGITLFEGIFVFYFRLKTVWPPAMFGNVCIVFG